MFVEVTRAFWKMWYACMTGFPKRGEGSSNRTYRMWGIPQLLSLKNPEHCVRLAQLPEGLGFSLLLRGFSSWLEMKRSLSCNNIPFLVIFDWKLEQNWWHNPLNWKNIQRISYAAIANYKYCRELCDSILILMLERENRLLNRLIGTGGLTHMTHTPEQHSTVDRHEKFLLYTFHSRLIVRY